MSIVKKRLLKAAAVLSAVALTAALPVQYAFADVNFAPVVTVLAVGTIILFGVIIAAVVLVSILLIRRLRKKNGPR